MLNLFLVNILVEDANEGEDYDVEEEDERKILLRKRTSPKQVTLPNGTTFVARYERISRKQLPINVHVRNARKIGPRNRNKSKMGSGPTKRARVTKKR